MNPKTILIAILCASLGSCVQNQWEISVHPGASNFERRVEWRPRSGIDATTRRRLEALYGKALVEQKDVFRYDGTFAGAMPQDLGGCGHHFTRRSNLGSTALFLESFRGPAHPSEAIERKLQAADDLTLFLRKLLAHEMKLEADDPILVSFVDGKLRRLFRDVAALSFAGELSTPIDQEAYAALGAALLQSALRSGFLSAEEAERSWIGASGDGDFFALLHWKQLSALKAHPRLAAWLESQQGRKAEPIPEAVAKDPEIASLLQRYGKQKANDLFGVTGAALVGAFGLLPRDELKLRLHTGRIPFATNGTWDADQGCVRWRNLIPLGEEWPTRTLFAAWSDPHAETQGELFGRVVLKDEDLATYCGWWQALSKERREEWSRFLEQHQGKLKRGGCEAFRFKGDEKEEQAPRGARLLGKKLQ